jgi:hypothetical protein
LRSARQAVSAVSSLKAAHPAGPWCPLNLPAEAIVAARPADRGGIELRDHRPGKYGPLGFDIGRTYADNGKSGLRLDGRDALKQLLIDVEGGSPGFKAVLVYDVSRWGRFQDGHESAYYEYVCRRSGRRDPLLR